jgi:hypothetical protein
LGVVVLFAAEIKPDGKLMPAHNAKKAALLSL